RLPDAVGAQRRRAGGLPVRLRRPGQRPAAPAVYRPVRPGDRGHGPGAGQQGTGRGAAPVPAPGRHRVDAERLPVPDRPRPLNARRAPPPVGGAPSADVPRRGPGGPYARSAHELLELLGQLEVLAALLRQPEGLAALGRGGAARGRLLLLLLALHRVAGALLALRLLLLLLLPAGAPAHARHPRHPGHATALSHAGHHLAGLEEPLDQVLHRADLDTGALGDPGAARAVDDRRLLALGRGHRLDDGGGAVDVALVEVVELVLHLAHARQHAEQLGDRAHLADLLHLGQEVVQGEVLALLG